MIIAAPNFRYIEKLLHELLVIVAVRAVDDMLKSLVRKIEQIPPARRTHTSLNA